MRHSVRPVLSRDGEKPLRCNGNNSWDDFDKGDCLTDIPFLAIIITACLDNIAEVAPIDVKNWKLLGNERVSFNLLE